MAVQQTECYRVVTIGYLKTFISGLIQNSSGGEVIIPATWDDTLCPTYSQLTGGTIIQYRVNADNPQNDVDGILINSTCYATGSQYASNQLVNQKDLSVAYTRYNSLSITAGKTTLSECGDDTSFTYRNNYKRYTKSMSNSCATAGTTTDVSSTTTAPTAYTSSNNAFSITNVGVLTVGKNGSTSGQASARTTNVTGRITFRGTTYTSNTVTVTQKALTGNWVDWYNDYRVDSKGIDSTGSTFGCDGGSYKATAYDVRTTWMKQRWLDSCDALYNDVTRNTGETSNVKVTIYNYAGSFSPCGTEGCNNTDSTPSNWNTEGYGVKTWTQSCAPSCTCDSLVVNPISGKVNKNGGIVNVATCSIGSCITNINVSSNKSWVNTLSIVGGNIRGTVSRNGDLYDRSAIITVTGNVDSNVCIKTVTLTQEAATCDVGVSYIISDVYKTCFELNGMRPSSFIKRTITNEGGECKIVEEDINRSIYLEGCCGEAEPEPENRTGSEKEYTFYVYKRVKNSDPTNIYYFGHPCSNETCSDGTYTREQLFNSDGTPVTVRVIQDYYDGDCCHNMQSSCCTYVYGTDNNQCNDFVHLSCNANVGTTDYLGLDTYRNGATGGSSGNVTSVLDTESSVYINGERRSVSTSPDWNTYIERIGTTTAGNAYGVVVKKKNFSDHPIYLLIKHNWKEGAVIPDEVGGKPLYKGTWYSAIIYKNCNTPCSSGETKSIGSCVSSTETSVPVQIGTYTKDPEACANEWRYNSAKSVSGTPFIDVSSIVFENNKIYGRINSTNNTQNIRTCQIPTALGDLNDYFTVNQCAGSTPTQCAVSMSLINNAPATGGTMYIGGYSTTGSCTLPTTITYVSGAGNFLSAIDVRSNGGIYATVAPNTSTSSRTSRYSISYGSSTSSADITQLGSTPTPTCSATLNMLTNIAPDEFNGQRVGTYTTNCEGTPKVTFDGLYSNFLSSISCDNGMVFANVAANVSSSPRQGQYKLTVGGQTSTSIATQLACSMRFHIIYVNNLSKDVKIEYIELRFEDGTSTTLNCYWEISAQGTDSQNVNSTLSHYGKHVTDVMCHGDAATIRVTPYDFIVDCDNTLRVTIG